MDEKYLIVGLGNPGREYRNNRHNIGFKMIDKFAEVNNVSFSRMQFNSLLTNLWIGNRNIILAKPQTYMNKSNQAVVSIIKYFKLDLKNLIICNDDLDLPLGTIRIRKSGSSGGQRGINSIIEGLGTKDFPRLRMGIGRPSGHLDAADYVLRDFANDEILQVNDMIERAVDAALLFIEKGIDAAMTKYNG
ncbi:aminoacyl-tRNA hydrolase [Chloroflexota bacterium]